MFSKLDETMASLESLIRGPKDMFTVAMEEAEAEVAEIKSEIEDVIEDKELDAAAKVEKIEDIVDEIKEKVEEEKEEEIEAATESVLLKVENFKLNMMYENMKKVGMEEGENRNFIQKIIDFVVRICTNIKNWIVMMWKKFIGLFTNKKKIAEKKVEEVKVKIDSLPADKKEEVLKTEINANDMGPGFKALLEAHVIENAITVQQAVNQMEKSSSEVSKSIDSYGKAVDEFKKKAEERKAKAEAARETANLGQANEMKEAAMDLDKKKSEVFSEINDRHKATFQFINEVHDKVMKTEVQSFDKEKDDEIMNRLKSI